MTTVVPLYTPVFRVPANDGGALVGGLLYSYAAGTSTPQALYTDITATTSLPNPAVLNARGEVEAWALAGSAYKFIVNDAAGNLIWSEDNVTPPFTLSGSFTQLIWPISAAETAAAVTPTNFGYPWGDPRRFVVAGYSWGSNAAADTTALQTWASIANPLTYPAIAATLNGSITLLSNTQVTGTIGGSITQTATNTAIFTATNASNIAITGMTGIGLGSDYPLADGSSACFLYANTCTAVSIRNCLLSNFGYSALYSVFGTDFSAVNNTITGISGLTNSSLRNYGICTDGTASQSVGVHIQGNSVTSCAQEIRISCSKAVRILDNRIWNGSSYGQHGMYIGGCVYDLVVSGNVVENPGLCGIKVQCSDSPALDCYGLVITGNNVYNAGSHGILLQSGIAPPGPSTQRIRSATVVGNVVNVTAGSGIYLADVVGAVIGDNFVTSCAQNGIFLSESQWLTVQDNYIASSGRSAIRDGYSCTYVDVKNNQINDCATATTAGDLYGIFVQGTGGQLTTTAEYCIEGNVITDGGSHMQYGINIATAQTTMTLRNNIVKDATSAGLSIGTPSAMRQYSGNYWGGAASATAEPTPATITAQGTITIPQGVNFLNITGTTNITNINVAGCENRMVTLQFASAGAPNVTAGNNIQIASNFTATNAPSSALTLVCSGLLWYEVGRKV